MNIQQVIYAVEVYKYHSFTEAAKAMYISQPRLSQAVRELEEELGFEIFIRSKKGISGATVKGIEFLEKANVLLAQFSALKSLKERNRASFHLASFPLSQAQEAFVALCNEEMSNTIPELEIELWVCGCSEAASRIRSMESEIGVIALLDDQYDDWQYYFKTSNIEYCELINSRPVVTVSKYSPLASKSEIGFDDLREYVYVADKYSRRNTASAKLHSILEELCPYASISVPDICTMYMLISGPTKNAFSFDVIPPSADLLAKLELVSIPFNGDLFVHFGYIKSSEHDISRLSTRFLELLHQKLGMEYKPEGKSVSNTSDTDGPDLGIIA